MVSEWACCTGRKRENTKEENLHFASI